MKGSETVTIVSKIIMTLSEINVCIIIQCTNYMHNILYNIIYNRQKDSYK